MIPDSLGPRTRRLLKTLLVRSRLNQPPNTLALEEPHEGRPLEARLVDMQPEGIEPVRVPCLGGEDCDSVHFIIIPRTYHNAACVMNNWILGTIEKHRRIIDLICGIKDNCLCIWSKLSKQSPPGRWTWKNDKRSPDSGHYQPRERETDVGVVSPYRPIPWLSSHLYFD